MPENSKLYTELLRIYYASLITGYISRARIYEALSRKYY
jgi:hypothetical protein